MYVDYPVYAEHHAESYDQAQIGFLRSFCNEYWAQIFDLAISAHNDAAIQLLGFSGRSELQTPKWSELQLEDFFNAMLEVAPLVIATKHAVKAKHPASAPADDAAQAAA